MSAPAASAVPMCDRRYLDLLRSLREDGRTIPEFKIKLRPSSNGVEVVQLALVDQDFIEQVELPLKDIEKAKHDLVFKEATRLVDRRKALRAP